MAIEHFVKVSGAWRSAREPDSFFVKVGGQWRSPQGTDEKFVKVNGQWRGASTAPPPLAPGVYILAATSIFLATAGVGFAEFNTVEYRGRITEIRARLSWTNTSLNNTTISCAGRPSGNFYRNIDNDNQEFNGRTIDHRIDTFDASSLTEFNSGAAIGFNLELTSDPNFLDTVISNVQLNLTIV